MIWIQFCTGLLFQVLRALLRCDHTNWDVETSETLCRFVLLWHHIRTKSYHNKINLHHVSKSQLQWSGLYTQCILYTTLFRSLWRHLKPNDSEKFQNWNIEPERKKFHLTRLAKQNFVPELMQLWVLGNLGLIFGQCASPNWGVWGGGCYGSAHTFNHSHFSFVPSTRLGNCL